MNEIKYPKGVGASLMKAHEERYADAMALLAEKDAQIARMQQHLNNAMFVIEELKEKLLTNGRS